MKDVITQSDGVTVRVGTDTAACCVNPSKHPDVTWTRRSIRRDFASRIVVRRCDQRSRLASPPNTTRPRRSRPRIWKRISAVNHHKRIEIDPLKDRAGQRAATDGEAVVELSFQR